MTDAGKENTEETVVEGKGRTQLEIMNNGSISLSFFASSSKFINGKRGQIPPCISCGQNGYEVDPKTPVQERMHTLALRIWLARK